MPVRALEKHICTGSLSFSNFYAEMRTIEEECPLQYNLKPPFRSSATKRFCSGVEYVKARENKEIALREAQEARQKEREAQRQRVVEVFFSSFQHTYLAIAE